MTAYAHEHLHACACVWLWLCAQGGSEPALPLGMRRFSVLSLVPGLSGLLAGVSSASSCAGALSDSVAVFVVAYTLMQACLGPSAAAQQAAQEA